MLTTFEKRGIYKCMICHLKDFYDLNQIIGNKTTPAIIPISKSSWWSGVKDGRFPQPVKLGKRTTVWRVKDIRLLFEKKPQQE